MKDRPTGYVLTGNKTVERETTQNDNANMTLNYYELYTTVLDAVLRYV